jgi:hypothetical protein
MILAVLGGLVSREVPSGSVTPLEADIRQSGPQEPEPLAAARAATLSSNIAWDFRRGV